LTERNASSPADGSGSHVSVALPDKLYFKVREVSAITGVAPYVLRYWETEFHQIRPKRTDAGQRLFRKRDVLQILEIKQLLYEKKYTIEGARRYLRERRRRSDDDAAPDRVFKEIRDELIKLRKMVS
jgi:DNA-binding transcriptional MerR regulator